MNVHHIVSPFFSVWKSFLIKSKSKIVQKTLYLDPCTLLTVETCLGWDGKKVFESIYIPSEQNACGNESCAMHNVHFESLFWSPIRKAQVRKTVLESKITNLLYGSFKRFLLNSPKCWQKLLLLIFIPTLKFAFIQSTILWL